MFEDRKDAGVKLAKALIRYKNKGVYVFGIPRGGVEVAFEVAKYLNADFSILVARKLPFPDNPEAGFGAVAEDGSAFIFENANRLLSEDAIAKIKKEQIAEIRRRIKILRNGESLPDIRDKTVILVDDGLAMGSTMRAAIMLCRNRSVGRIVAAVPVAGEDTAFEISKLADETEVLERPAYFRAVAQAYRNWYDVGDEEVRGIMKKWKSRIRKGE